MVDKKRKAYEEAEATAWKAYEEAIAPAKTTQNDRKKSR